MIVCMRAQPIWSGFASQPLFESQSANGLHLPPATELILTLIVQLDQLCEKRSGEAEARLRDWPSMCAQYPVLKSNNKAHKEWIVITDRITNMGCTLVHTGRSKPLIDHWIEGHISISDCFSRTDDPLSSGPNRSVDIHELNLWSQRVFTLYSTDIHQVCNDTLRKELAAQLHACLDLSSPSHNTGAPQLDRPDDQFNIRHGTRLVAHLPHGVKKIRGSSARSEGFTFEWNTGLLGMDEEGHVTYARERIQLGHFSCQSVSVCAYINARDAIVNPIFICWRKMSKLERLEMNKIRERAPIDIEASLEFLHTIIEQEQLHGITALYSLDGGWRRTVEGSEVRDEGSCAAMRHDGIRLGGSMSNQQVAHKSYQTEMAAHMCATQDAKGKRAMCVFDATSPIEALISFRDKHDRHRHGYLLDDWLAELSSSVSDCEVVVDVWAKAHRGILLNEWADTSCTQLMNSTDPNDDIWFDINPAPHHSYRFHSFRPIFQEVCDIASQGVETWLKSFSKDTVWPSDEVLHTELSKLSPRVARSIIEIRTHRAMPAQKNPFARKRGGFCPLRNPPTLV